MLCYVMLRERHGIYDSKHVDLCLMHFTDTIFRSLMILFFFFLYFFRAVLMRSFISFSPFSFRCKDGMV